MKAAVLYEPKTPLVIEDIELDDPKEGEVLVENRRSRHLPQRPPLHARRRPYRSARGTGPRRRWHRRGRWSWRHLRPPRPAGDTVLRHRLRSLQTPAFRATPRSVTCTWPPAPTCWTAPSACIRADTRIHHMGKVACFAEYAVIPEMGLRSH